MRTMYKMKPRKWTKVIGDSSVERGMCNIFGRADAEVAWYRIATSKKLPWVPGWSLRFLPKKSPRLEYE